MKQSLYQQLQLRVLLLEHLFFCSYSALALDSTSRNNKQMIACKFQPANMSLNNHQHPKPAPKVFRWYPTTQSLPMPQLSMVPIFSHLKAPTLPSKLINTTLPQFLLCIINEYIFDTYNDSRKHSKKFSCYYTAIIRLIILNIETYLEYLLCIYI